MPTRYEVVLTELWNLPPKEFVSIPEFDDKLIDAVIDRRELSKLSSKEQSLLLNMCRAVSPPAKDLDLAVSRKYPKWVPVRPIARGGESLVILVKNREVGRLEVMKIPGPIIETNKKEKGKQECKQVQKKEDGKIEKDVDYWGENKADKKPSSFKKLIYKAAPKKYKTSARGFGMYPDQPVEVPLLDYAREAKILQRNFMVHRGVYSLSRKIDPKCILGYIPEPFEFAPAPESFSTMEYVPGTSMLDYCNSVDYSEKFSFFIKLVTFIVKVFHEYKVAHCDLTPKNVLVKNGCPVVLDFGLVKTPNLEELTIPGTRKGTPLYSSSTQMTDAKMRGQTDDIIALGRILWVIINRTEPDTSHVVIMFDDNQDPIYDEQTLQAIADCFVPEAIADPRLRQIFVKTQNYMYEDSLDLLNDLHTVYMPMENTVISNSCASPCSEIVDIFRKVEELFPMVEANRKELTETKKMLFLLMKILSGK